MSFMFGKRWSQFWVVLWVTQDSEIIPVNIYRFSCTHVGSCIVMMEENLLHIRRNSFNSCFQFFQSIVAVHRGRISAIGHEFQMHYTINVTENREHKFATEWCDLQNSLVLANICDSWAHSCHFQWYYCKRIVSFTLILKQQLLPYIHPFLFLSFTAHSRQPSCVQLLLSKIGCYHLYLHIWHDSFMSLRLKVFWSSWFIPWTQFWWSLSGVIQDLFLNESGMTEICVSYHFRSGFLLVSEVNISKIFISCHSVSTETTIYQSCLDMSEGCIMDMHSPAWIK